MQYGVIFIMGYKAVKCEMLGYCPETKGCGKYPKKDGGN